METDLLYTIAKLGGALRATETRLITVTQERDELAAAQAAHVCPAHNMPANVTPAPAQQSPEPPANAAAAGTVDA